MNGLILHDKFKGTHLVTFETLQALPAPATRGRWHRPIRHAEVVEVLRSELVAAQLAIREEEFGLSKDGGKLFGIIKFQGGQDFSGALGFRSSTDSTIAIRGVAGVAVLVCDNMALSGDEFVFRHKSTIRIELRSIVRDGVAKYQEHARQIDRSIEQLQERSLSDRDASEEIVKMLRKGGIPTNVIAAGTRNYFEPRPEWTDVAPRTAWGLHNAFTRAINEMPLRPQMRASQEIGKALGL